MTTKDPKTLRDLLHSLGLRGIVDALDDILALAAKHRWSATQVFEHALQLELDERTRRSLERRLGRSNIGRFKPLADFDWDWPTSIDRKKIDAAMHLDFIASARNIVFVAAQGLGKTMIAQNVAHAAALAGHTVLVNTSTCSSTSPLRTRTVARSAPSLLVCHPTPRPRRARVSLLRQPQRRPALPGRQPPLRKAQPHLDYQPRLQGLAHRLPQFRLHDRSHRPHRPPRRRRTHQGQELPTPRSPRRRDSASKHGPQVSSVALTTAIRIPRSHAIANV